jgi:hypothetical protein
MTPTTGACTVWPAGPWDLLVALRARVVGAAGGQAPTDASQLERQAWAEMMCSEGVTIYLAEIDGVAVGTATLVIVPNITYEYAPTAFVKGVFVAASQRR